MKPIWLTVLVSLSFVAMTPADAPAAEPVRVAIARLTHDHVFWLLGRPRDRGDIQIVGVFEPNEDLAARRAAEFDLDPSILFTDLDRMLAATTPEAVCCFGSIREHREDTLRSFRAGAHVMVEKPLALTAADAEAMAAAARRADRRLLTNYETTWYASHHAMKARLDAGELGPVRRLVFRTGHRGPIEIGCRPEFLAWLLDPQENGGGAITDFGCYGANLATWLMGGRPPKSVWATAQTIKPERYPNVDDDATIVLDYGDAVAVVQPSWNWPLDVKETAIHCERGELVSAGDAAYRLSRRGEEASPHELAPSGQDPFAHLAAVVRGETEPNALSSLENNLIVMRILDAARESAASGERVPLE